MGKPRTATNILESKGAFKKNPNRKRPNEPKVTNPFPTSAPEQLSDEQVACWNEIVSIAPAGVLTGADTIIVEIGACLLAEFREKQGAIDTARITRLTTELGKLGLTPSSRAGLTVDKPKGNEFD